MKFLSRFNFALCVIAFIGVMALAVVNIARGIIGIKGILIAALFVILMGLIVILSWRDIKTFDNKEKFLKK
ncbi:MAG: hypothetical protein J6U85_03470 [Bacteroidales bacterium]|nr:hypothetical protein [Bacteroidales bacterium]